MFTHDLYRALVLGFDNPLLVNEVGTLWFSVTLTSGLSMFDQYVKSQLHDFAKIWPVAVITQVFYCYRAAVFTRSKYAVALIAMVRDRCCYVHHPSYIYLDYCDASFLLPSLDQLLQWQCRQERQVILPI